ncbi:RNA polymerase sigma factor [Dyadobacter frigoris]|uniref:Sigma-70 family RNA polymerase sigma factor n=1 Tax=Dyadobacter frigoris TaxID=2576211 RepID=A0A4U6CNL8_9BACT|nr:sigma-70 family RNA polymerase sigma factor [Dyadobacter frigoris]TKT85686.1 sigma-70 family RNA polymerase sigma factor [Dyadobacter frigoris]GLU57322.1 DNA-directed RNA polymerase sigma-70 factor [Dyadobacter frigoris]
MEKQQLIPHLFRTEYRKITSVLCKRFGIEHIEMAEDIASDTFLLAVEVWSYKGLPENPTAWLYAVARNKAKNQLTRNAIFSEKIAGELQLHSDRSVSEIEIDLSDENISDSQLQMLFALCHPSIPVEAQIGLSLRILCGFGIEEIADAFLTNKATINKRLFRAKEKLRLEKIRIVFPDEIEIDKRLETVLTTLYLLFNEGYYSESQNEVLRNDLCLEAIRLAYLLHENDKTNTPPVNALLALMCFHSSRFEARKSNNGEVILYDDQDESLWNKELIAKGMYFLSQASKGKLLSKYHIESSIAYWHTVKADSEEKWGNILQLYNQLLILEYSPVAALNRTYALSKVKGKMTAIPEAEKINLVNNHFYFMLLGTLYENVDNEKAKMNLQSALLLAKSDTDKQVIQKKLLKFEQVF